VFYSRWKLSFWKSDVRFCVNIGLIILLWLVSVLSAMAADAAPSTSGPIPVTFFGMHMHRPVVMGKQPWPTVPFGAGRLWDSGADWQNINTAKGVYDWSILDKWLTAYHEHGVDDLLYTFGHTPRWASSKPDDTCGLEGKGPVGFCDPPEDLKPDGTGSDQHWKDFVSAIATHAKNSHGAHIRYWEIWNEPFMTRMWTGTNAQLERMAQDAREILLNIDSSAVIVSPPPAMKNPNYEHWMESYLHDGGGKHSDVIAFHGYIHNGRTRPVAADIIIAVKDLRKMLDSHGMGALPIFDTEAGWGRSKAMGFDGDDDFQEGFLAQFYLLHWSEGISRFYWYAWNNPEFGTLWSPDPGNPAGPGHLTRAGVAYKQLQDWMVGATMQPLCSSTGGGIWTCGFTRPGGYEAVVVWSTDGNKSYAANPKFKKMRDLDGNSSPIAGGKVNIGVKPILLQNQ
jgi:hypothetical protein